MIYQRTGAQCRGCGVGKHQHRGQWWSLNNYYGITGNFCSDCYDKLARDGHGEPRNPKENLMMLLKLSVDK